MKQASIFWCTGMSGVGKSTIAEAANNTLSSMGLSVLILDGDVIREKYRSKLGFGESDIRANNINIANICKSERSSYDVIIVAIISPIDQIRCEVRELLSPLFYLVYVYADVETLRDRDPKGLYSRADRGEITNLIGYSKSNPYEVPEAYDCLIATSMDESTEPESKSSFVQFIKKSLIEKTYDSKS